MELSPLIDCIFQLLIFFMLSSTFLTPAIQLTLPFRHSWHKPKRVRDYHHAGESGDVHLNKMPTSLIALESELKRLLEKSKKKSVTIRGDENMPYSAFLDALDIAKRSEPSTSTWLIRLSNTRKPDLNQSNSDTLQ